MKVIKLKLICLIYIINLFLSFNCLGDSEESLLTIISNENEFIGTRVITEGILCATADGIALVISTEACRNGFLSMGIGLDADNYVYEKRELYGHMGPVSISGELISKKGVVALDRENFRLMLTKIKIKQLPLGNFKITKIPINKKGLKYVNLFIEAVENKNVAYLAKRFSLKVSELKADNRLNWLLFNSTVSFKQFLSTTKRYIDFYEGPSLVYSDYYFCISNKLTNYKQYSDMPAGTESKNSNCFEYFSEDNNEFRISTAFLEGAY